MKRSSSTGAGSLDMLLDTMCNTFGGVCFIALMVAIMSASLPPATDGDGGGEGVSEQMVVNKETARLSRERDELKAAIAIQKDFVATHAESSARALSAAQLADGISSNATALARLRKEKLELEDKLARLTTDISYSTREAARLSRLLKDLEERLDRPVSLKNRSVRTPVERKLDGYQSVDVWIRNGRMYCLGNERHVDCRITNGAKGREWDYTVRPGAGFLLDDAFYRSAAYRQLMEQVSGRTFMRIYCDAASFANVCDLRDDLIRRRKLYNWHVCEDSVLHFVEGYDGRVQ